MERIGVECDQKTKDFLTKASLLSYYIATYNAVNDQLGFDNEPVTVDEIFDFINDLKHEGGATNMPNITKMDISLTFKLLLNAGLSKQMASNFPVLSN